MSSILLHEYFNITTHFSAMNWKYKKLTTDWIWCDYWMITENIQKIVAVSSNVNFMGMRLNNYDKGEVHLSLSPVWCRIHIKKLYFGQEQYITNIIQSLGKYYI